MLKTYEQTLTYLYDNLPMYHRVGAAAYRIDLLNTIKLLAVLGNPEKKIRTIHVAGTNGKGSTCHMLASILQTAGYKTGLYTSPHLKNLTERIRVNGIEIAKDKVVDFINRIEPLVQDIKPSFFEITVAMAFDHFVQEAVDVAVIEVGLGGRLDSTNVIMPEISVITNIGLDHQDLLGDTLEKIAFEKAGIIKEMVPVVISERQVATDHVFESQAARCQAPIYFAPDDYRLTTHIQDGLLYHNVFFKGDLILRDLYIPLQGYYQTKNLVGVLKAIEVLDQNNWGITAQHIVNGLMEVVSQTGLKGRWQKLDENPLIICDTGHNADGINAIVNQIQAQTFEKLHIVWGAVKDKDLQAVLKILPTHATYYFCEPQIPRALDAEQLASMAKTFGLTGYVVKDVNEALRKAKEEATKDDMIFIGGSTFVVAEIENL